MHREAFPGRFNGKGPFDSSDHAFDPAEWSPSDFVADTLYEKAKLIGPDSPDLPLSRYLKWSLLFSRYRFELAAQMQQIHGTRLRLMTPALVDFSNWLDDRYDVKLAEQVAVMGRIARRPGSTRVHGFAPFDPLREALHRAGSRPGEAPLDLAKRAVREEGFVGVKLYPPIGFLPLNNRSLSYLDFPEHLGSFRRKLRGELDTILGELYGWCVEEQVPVLAHASDSNGAGPGYSGRANPDNWAAVLKNYPGLRLSVAHFGDFDEGFATKERPRPKIEDTWEWKMAKLAQDNPTVFIDMSYFRSALLAPDHAIRKEVVRMLREVKRNFRVLSQRLMFGTDWTMFGQEQLFTPINTGGRYADRVFDLLRQEIQFTEDEIDGVGFSNAAAFLGLALPESGKNNRARLRNFYDRHHLDAGWLSELTA
jgi:predicted TIM-barrel fold metal-dependent hydrolase